MFFYLTGFRLVWSLIIIVGEACDIFPFLVYQDLNAHIRSTFWPLKIFSLLS